MFGLRHSLTANEQRGLDRHGEPEPTNLRAESTSACANDPKARGAFARLAIGLQAELLRLQQLADNGVADLVAELVEFGRQPAQALAGPTQRRHGIAACIWLDKCVQIVEQLGIGFGQRFAPASRTTNAASRERIQRFNVFQAASDRARGDARHTRHRGDAVISRGLGFRRSEKPPLPFVEMRQHRRVALLERIFIDHPQELRRATPAWNPPSHALKPDPIQLLSYGPKLTGGMAGNPMDQRIESFLADVLALAGEDLDAVREGVRVAVASCEALFRVREPTIGEHLKLVLSGIDRQVR